MKHSRLPWLLALLALVAVWRWLNVPDLHPAPALVDAVKRPSTTSDVPPIGHAGGGESASAGLTGVRPPASLPVGDAFLVRPTAQELAARQSAPATPIPAKPKPAPPIVAVETLPQPAPVPPLPPLQVIGTWDDDRGSSVFLAGQRSTVQARVGDMVLADFRVVQIDRSQVLLKQMSSNREIRLTVPFVPGRAQK